MEWFIYEVVTKIILCRIKVPVVNILLQIKYIVHEEPICVQWSNASILVLYQYDINHLLIINLYTNFYIGKKILIYIIKSNQLV